jgi:hypothetical protein
MTTTTLSHSCESRSFSAIGIHKFVKQKKKNSKNEGGYAENGQLLRHHSFFHPATFIYNKRTIVMEENANLFLEIGAYYRS